MTQGHWGKNIIFPFLLFLAAIAALYVTMSVRPSVGLSVGRSRTSFNSSKNVQNSTQSIERDVYSSEHSM